MPSLKTYTSDGIVVSKPNIEISTVVNSHCDLMLYTMDDEAHTMRREKARSRRKSRRRLSLDAPFGQEHAGSLYGVCNNSEC